MQPQTAAHRITEMLRIRRFEEQLIRLAEQGHVPGHYHVYIGQEATAVAACAHLTPRDYLFSTWRNHGHLLARGADPGKMLAEIMGRAGGYARGKSGTLHLAVPGLGIPATTALVGANLPLAAGAALAAKRAGEGIAVAFFGDAALEEGAFSESLNLAALWRVPLLLICENNSIPPEQRRRGQYTSSSLTAAALVDVPRAYRVPATVLDGTDMESLAEGLAQVTASVRATGTPAFVEVQAARWPGNFMLWPELVGGEWQLDWAFGAAPDAPELAAWVRESDPLLRCVARVVAAGVLTRDQVAAIDARVRAEMAAAAEFALASPFPAPAEAYQAAPAEGGRPA